MAGDIPAADTREAARLRKAIDLSIIETIVDVEKSLSAEELIWTNDSKALVIPEEQNTKRSNIQKDQDHAGDLLIEWRV